jgi:hypothetical protein
MRWNDALTEPEGSEMMVPRLIALVGLLTALAACGTYVAAEQLRKRRRRVILARA